MKKENSTTAITCLTEFGPLFGNCHPDICITSKCKSKTGCWICSPSYLQYDYHPKYRSSLFVDTNSPDIDNFFSVSDYEVYTFDICKDYVYQNCKYPDIIWNYIETHEIPYMSLQKVRLEDDLRNDLNLIHCDDIDIRLKVSQCCIKNRSNYLPHSEIVTQEYDSYLREWGGDYKWQLVFRASTYEYRGYSFHENCDGYRPTFTIIKSREGWIFGGYTTQTWSGNGISISCTILVRRRHKRCESIHFHTQEPFWIGAHSIFPKRFFKIIYLLSFQLWSSIWYIHSRYLY